MSLPKGAITIIVAVITAIGTMGAAWITARQGVVSFPNPNLERQVKDLKAKLDNRSSIAGDFEWQWAGENWLGSVKFKSLTNGTISAASDMRAVTADPRTELRTYIIRPVFHSPVEGSVTVNGSSFTLNMPVTVDQQYLRMHHKTSKNVVLDAELQPVDAFAGRVRYLGDEAQPLTGDIILVRYRSDVRKW